jgi:uncharacterized phage protein (TIGR01671 family)
MREIKFRGYDGMDWIYGSAIEYIKEVDFWYIIEEGSPDDDWVIVNRVGQYTGLKDQNGKEIYEGDILQCHHNTNGSVFFHDGAFRLSSDQCETVLEDIQTYDDHDDLNFYLIEDNNLVVIGNIYDNPELLNYEITK